jgi:hypothetical protein
LRPKCLVIRLKSVGGILLHFLGGRKTGTVPNVHSPKAKEAENVPGNLGGSAWDGTGDTTDGGKNKRTGAAAVTVYAFVSILE